MGTKDDRLRPSASALALADEAAHGLARRMPELSAHKVITPGQVVALLAVFAALAAFGLAAPAVAWTALVALTTAAFLAGTLFRAALACLSGAPAAPIAPFDGELPLYTILVPLYREANVLPRLARALLLLDYPKNRLDIKLIVEDDDAETLAVADALAGRGPFDVVRVPHVQPRTKPKACNYALHFARGEFTVIFDAEDRPERDQLRKAVAVFRRRAAGIVCLQARLAFYNADECWLTRGIMALTPQDLSAVRS